MPDTVTLVTAHVVFSRLNSACSAFLIFEYGGRLTLTFSGPTKTRGSEMNQKNAQWKGFV